MNSANISAILNAIQGKRILVVGDVILDHYIWGDVRRVSPEAPVPLVDVERESWAAGGAANVASNLVSLGLEPVLVGTLGKDDNAERLQAILRQQEIAFNPAFCRDDVATITKIRVVARHQQLCRLDKELPRNYYNVDFKSQLPWIENAIENADGVILSDYAKGVLEKDLIQAIRKLCHENKIPLACDPKPKFKRPFEDMDLLTPNRAEAVSMSGVEWDPRTDFPAEAICARMYEKYNPRHLVITLGSDGMLYAESGKLVSHIPTYAREVFDVSGAGDTVIATLAACLSAGIEMPEAVPFANMAAGVVVSKLGTATVRPDEITAYAGKHGFA